MPSGRQSSLLHPRENRWHKEIRPKGPTHLPGIPSFEVCVKSLLLVNEGKKEEEKVFPGRQCFSSAF